jgi:hypothetical protein
MIPHPCREGERIHFLRSPDLEAALRHGYLELQLVGDSGMTNRVVLYHPSSGVYEWYEALEGIQPEAVNRRTYANLEFLVSEHDLHTYKWYPYFPQGKVLFDYHGLLEETGGRLPAMQWEKVS